MPQDRMGIQYKTYGKRRSIRLEGWDYATSCVYHVTLTTHGRGVFFNVPVRVGAFVDALRLQTARMHYMVYAFCVMPDHVHVLCQPNAERPISLISFVQQLKSGASRRLHLLGAAERIWQRGFHDHILRREENIAEVVNYILANPVRAGLTTDYAVYPYSYAAGIKNYLGPKNVVRLPESKPAG